MSSNFAEKQAKLKAVQKENETLKQAIASRNLLLMQAFWQKYPLLTDVETLSFTSQELMAWVHQKAHSRRRA
jgi:hypothetical protein